VYIDLTALHFGRVAQMVASTREKAAQSCLVDADHLGHKSLKRVIGKASFPPALAIGHDQFVAFLYIATGCPHLHESALVESELYLLMETRMSVILPGHDVNRRHTFGLSAWVPR
jgi:hypothetical protein